MNTRNPLSDQRGVALAMALIIMTTLMALMGAFAVLATSEPRIANNQMASTQARAMAESGMERALWALTAGNNPGAPAGALVLQANYNLPAPLPAPYDGATFVAVNSIGGFKVTVADGPQPNQKLVTAVGFVPNANKPIAVKKIQVTVTRPKWINPMCALCAGGENPPATTTTVQIGGNATVTAASGYCPGAPTPQAAVSSTGTVAINGNPNLGAPSGGTGSKAYAYFPQGMILSNSDMAFLRAKAKSMGAGHYFSGSQQWTAPPANGLIFVDTPSGNPLSNSSPASDMITVDISGNWNATWSGWLVVAGSVYIHGNVTMTGMIYAQNDATLHGDGHGGGITGAVISTNRVDNVSTTVDDEVIGNMPITYNCPAVRSGNGFLSQAWSIVPGTYKEISGK